MQDFLAEKEGQLYRTRLLAKECEKEPSSVQRIIGIIIITSCAHGLIR